MSGGQFLGLIALMIPIGAIVSGHLRRWQKLDVAAAERDVDIRRRFRAFDQIETRVADIEAHVTSPEYRLNKELGQLADKPRGSA